MFRFQIEELCNSFYSKFPSLHTVVRKLLDKEDREAEEENNSGTKHSDHTEEGEGDNQEGDNQEGDNQEGDNPEGDNLGDKTDDKNKDGDNTQSTVSKAKLICTCRFMQLIHTWSFL